MQPPWQLTTLNGWNSLFIVIHCTASINLRRSMHYNEQHNDSVTHKATS